MPRVAVEATLAVTCPRPRQVHWWSEGTAAVTGDGKQDLAAVRPPGEDDLLPKHMKAVRHHPVPTQAGAARRRSRLAARHPLEWPAARCRRQRSAATARPCVAGRPKRPQARLEGSTRRWDRRRSRSATRSVATRRARRRRARPPAGFASRSPRPSWCKGRAAERPPRAPTQAGLLWTSPREATDRKTDLHSSDHQGPQGQDVWPFCSRARHALLGTLRSFGLVHCPC